MEEVEEDEGGIHVPAAAAQLSQLRRLQLVGDCSRVTHAGGTALPSLEEMVFKV